MRKPNGSSSSQVAMNNYVIHKETNIQPRLLTYLNRKPLAGLELIAHSTAYECEKGESDGRNCQRVKLEAKVGDPLPKAGSEAALGVELTARLQAVRSLLTRADRVFELRELKLGADLGSQTTKSSIHFWLDSKRGAPDPDREATRNCTVGEEEGCGWSVRGQALRGREGQPA